MFIPASNWPPPISRGVWISLALAVVLVLSTCFAVVARAQPAGDAFAAGAAAFAEGDIRRALAFFEDAREAGSAGPAVHFNIAVCHFRLEQYVEAADAFQHVADTYPAMRELALYNLGLVRLRENRPAAARDVFVDVRAHSDDEKLVALASEQLRRLTGASPSVPRSIWISFVDVNLGYDDNVALVDESSVPATQSVDSAFTEFLGVLTGPRGASSGFRFDGTLYVVRHDAAPEFDQTAVRLGGVYQWVVGGWRIETGPRLDYSTLDGRGFEQRAGLDLAARRTLRPGVWLTLRAAHEETDGASDAFAYLDGSREQLSASLNRRGAAGRFSVGMDLERNDRADPRVSPTRNRLWVGYRYAAEPRWNVDARLALRRSSYDDLATSRDEDLVDLGIGYTRYLDDGWEIGGRYRWSDNDSVVDVFTYSRSRLSFGVTKNF